jgi:hypothetical protein
MTSVRDRDSHASFLLSLIIVMFPYPNPYGSMYPGGGEVVYASPYSADTNTTNHALRSLLFMIVVVVGLGLLGGLGYELYHWLGPSSSSSSSSSDPSLTIIPPSSSTGVGVTTTPIYSSTPAVATTGGAGTTIRIGPNPSSYIPTSTSPSNAFFSLDNTISDSTGVYSGTWVPDTTTPCNATFQSMTLPNSKTGYPLSVPCASMGQYLDLGGLIPGNTFSWQAWFYNTLAQTNGLYTTLIGAPGFTQSGGFYGGLYSGSAWGYTQFQQGTQCEATQMGTGVSPTNTWIHVAMTYSPTTGTLLYYNGVAQTSSITSACTDGSWASSTKERMTLLGPAVASTGNIAFQGSVWNLVVNDTQLTASQVQSMYTNQLNS